MRRSCGIHAILVGGPGLVLADFLDHRDFDQAIAVATGPGVERIVAKVSRPESAIFNFHCPPKDTPIDLAPQLTKDMRIKQRAGTVSMQHVGSDAVRAIHERHKPMLGLHGHIHESRGEAWVGLTLCLNPGSEYNQGVLQGVLVDLEDGRVKRHQFTVG